MTLHPESYVILWVAADETAEKYKAGASVVSQIKARVGNQIGFVPVTGLGFEACHWHPTVADAALIAGEIERIIEQNDLLAP